MKRRNREVYRRLERDSALLKEAVPVMKAALAKMTEYEAEAREMEEVIGIQQKENLALRKSYKLQAQHLFDLAEELAETRRAAEDLTALVEEYEAAEDEAEDGVTLTPDQVRLLYDLAVGHLAKNDQEVAKVRQENDWVYRLRDGLPS